MEQTIARIIHTIWDNWQVVVGIVVLLLVGSGLLQDLRARENVLQSKLEMMQKSLQKEMTGIRTLTEEQSVRDREVFQVGLYNFNESVSRIMGEMNRTQQGQFDTFGGQMHAATRVTEEQVDRIKSIMDERMARFTDMLNDSMGRQGQRLEDVTRRLDQTLTNNEERIDALYDTLEQHLRQMRATNQQRMQQLQTKPDRGVMDACMSISQQLDRVAKGLNELQMMAGGALDVRRVLDYLKLRGAWAEVEIEELLDAVLAAGQYRARVAVRPGSEELADYAVVLPGHVEEGDRQVYLPIVTGFPIAEHEQLVRAMERQDAAAIETASKALELALRVQAKHIREAFVDPPHTTDYAILFLPTEGLYAQMVQDSTLREQLQQQYRVLLSGPSTMAALLGSLQTGLRSLTMEQRAKELRSSLGSAREQLEELRGSIGMAAGKASGEGSTAEPAGDAQSVLDVERRRFEERYGAAAQAEPRAAAQAVQATAPTSAFEDDEEEMDRDEWD